MTCTLLVWGFDVKDPWRSQELKVCVEHGGTSKDGDFEFRKAGKAAWCAVQFSNTAAATTCANDLQTSFSHLRVCMEPDWRSFGGSQASAAAELIQLAEWLGCRGEPHALPRLEGECLARGAPAVLAALERVGGYRTLALLDQEAAAYLGHSLVEVSYITRSWRPTADDMHWFQISFGQLGPQMLPLAAAEVRREVPGSPQRACAAARLTETQVATQGYMAEHNICPERQLSAKQLERIASDCIGLLRAVVLALSDCSTAIGLGTQTRAAQQVWPRDTVLSLGERSICLQMTAQSLVACLRKRILRSAIDERQLLDAAGQLLPQLVTCVEVEDGAAAAGMWPEECGRPAVGCVRDMHITLNLIRSTMDEARCAAAGLPALHSTVVKALRTAVDRMATPQHVGLLLGLVLLVQHTRPATVDTDDICSVAAQLARVLRLACTWLDSDEARRLLQSHAAGSQPVRPFGLGQDTCTDQLSLLADISAQCLSGEVVALLHKCKDGRRTVKLDSIISFDAIRALSAALENSSVSKCWNVRGQCPDLGFEAHVGHCHAPGLWAAVDALLNFAVAPYRLELAYEAGSRRPWATKVVMMLAHGGTDVLYLAQAEAEAQAALPDLAPAARRAGHQLVFGLRRSAAKMLAAAAQCMTPPLARILGQTGTAPALLQTLQLLAEVPPAEHTADTASWAVAVRAVSAICELLAAVLTDHAPARAAMLQDGSWDTAGVDSIRMLLPPPALAAEWAEQREALLDKVSSVLGGSGGGSRQQASANAAAADADAVAAAERAMQELLAEEDAAAVPAQPSKAAMKRARKKTARQQAAAAAAPQEAKDAASTPGPAPATTSRAQPSEAADPSCSSVSQDAAPVLAAAAGVTDLAPGSQGMELRQQSADASGAAAELEWWRCPLSGEAMRDPVLWGDEGHSFEREALAKWLNENPGVHPLSRHPLGPEESSVVPNHALRNLIQQLQPSRLSWVL